jgi:hypothetical protein
MRTKYPDIQEFGMIQKTFNTTTVAVGSLYLATHSVVITLIGAVTSTVLASCLTKLRPSQRLVSEQRPPNHHTPPTGATER